MFCTWKKQVSTSLDLQASKHFPIERAMDLLFKLPLQTTKVYGLQVQKSLTWLPLVASSLEYLHLSVPAIWHVPVIFLSRLACTHKCVFLDFLFLWRFWWLLPQLIWNQQLSKCGVFVQGGVHSRSLCVDQVFGSCRIGCVYWGISAEKEFPLLAEVERLSTHSFLPLL